LRALEAALTHSAHGVLLARPRPDHPEHILIDEANGAFVRQTGWSQAELRGRGLDVIAGPGTDERKQGRLIRRALTTACAIGGRFVFARKNGQEMHAEVTIVPVGRQGQVELLVLLFRDMTAEDELSLRLALSERLAAVGALAAGLGHEVNSPLAAVLMHLQLMEESLPRFVGDAERLAPMLAEQAAQLDEHVESARSRAEQVSAAVQSLQLLVSAQGGVDPDNLVDLPAAVDAAIRLARPELRARARLVRSYQDVPAVGGDAARVQQAFVQLFLHIARVLPEGDATTREVRVTLATGGDERVTATVECRAPDVAPDELAQGLGPSIIQSIVASYGGRLNVVCNPTGARFEIELPARASRGTSGRALARRGRLLIVDDDTHLLSSLRLALVDDHDVDTAPGGGAALERLRGGDDAYDLILCDVQMEGLSGIDVLETLRREAPGAARRFVFMTGGAATERSRAYLAGSETECLGKPFELDRLRHLVRQRVRDQRLAGEET